jgi:hypothetical protein
MTAPFFNCQFLFTADELAAGGPIALFQDAESEPFMQEFLEACQGAPAEVYRSVGSLPAAPVQIYMTATTWARRHEELIAAGACGPRARVLLYFDSDPTGYWDFAMACGPALGRFFASRTLDRPTLDQLGPYLEHWIGARPFHARLTSMAGIGNREYRDRVVAHGGDIARVFFQLADDESRSVYSRIMFGRHEEIFDKFSKKVFGEQQYMEVVNLKPGDHIINCGVGGGWELPYFICKLNGEGAIHNFDINITYQASPFSGFIRHFSQMIRDNKTLLGTRDGTVDLPTTTGSMVQSGPEAAASASSRSTFPIRRLDSLAAEGMFSRIDYIKMDVEGGEFNILQGGIETIRQYRPNLAIAIYHEPDHFWEYPLFLMNNLQNYRYYLRQYGYSRFETLLYAVPIERTSVAGEDEEAEGEVAANLVFYLYDKSPRRQFLGSRRVMSRFEGVSWAKGDIETAPWTEADRMVAVWEGGSRAILSGLYLNEAGDVTLNTGGASARPDRVDWLHSIGFGPGATVLPIWNTPREMGIAAFWPGRPMALGYWDGVRITDLDWRAALDVPGTPVLISWRDRPAGYACFSLSDDRRALTLSQFHATGERASDDRSLPSPAGAFRGVVSVNDLNKTEDPRPGFAFEAGADGLCEIFLLEDSGLKSVGKIHIDPLSDIVPALRVRTPLEEQSVRRSGAAA